MSDFIRYQQCPVCRSAAISKVFSCRDNTVSEDVFEVWKCASCTVRFTQNIPDEHRIGMYYKSSAYVSHTDTKKGFINTIYHWVRNHTLGTKQKLVQAVSGAKSGNLLDAGAGTGAFASHMAKAGWTVSAIEPDEQARSLAKEKYQLDMLLPGNLHTLQKGSFNVITMWHVLEHVHDLHGYLDSFSRLLSTNGKLLIAVPNYTGYDATKYNNCWAAYDVPRHLYHFSPKSMEVLLDKHGFTLQQMKPMWFDSFYVDMLSEKYMTKGNMFRALWRGLVTDIKTIKDTTECSSIIYVAEKKG